MIAPQPIALKAAAPETIPSRRERQLANYLEKCFSNNPILTIFVVSVIAVSLNCYPIIFCGRSYVSPATVPSLVYDGWPPIGSMPRNETFVPQHGSDTGAMMWWDVPVGFVQSRSLLEWGELPLWNRYGHSGAPLIGQGVSMLGDPLQLIVILGHGSALAWDLKFVIAKLLFCIGFGSLILRLLGSRPLSLIYAALGAYCGAYFFIASHPVFFVLTYAPWILLSAIELLDQNSKSYFRWGLIWLLVNVGCFNGGHVEVAVDLIAGMNLAALVDALARQNTTATRLKVIGRIASATLFFLAVTAPVWVSFLVALDGSFSVHSEVKVFQQSLKGLPGAFDDEFFRGVSNLAPGSSLLVMVGVILSFANWRQFQDQTFFWVNGGAVLLWGGCVFGWIPRSVLELIPLWNRVGHLGVDISYLLVIHLTIQSAYGFKSLVDSSSFRKTVSAFLWVALIFLLIMLKYSFLLTSLPNRWYYFLWVGLGGIGAPLLYSFLKNQYRSIPLLGWVGIILLGFVSQHRFGLYTFGDKGSLMVPGPRVQLNAKSESIEQIKHLQADPFRAVSLQRGYSGTLSGEYSAVYQLEDIRSCAPLGSTEYVNLLQHFPGMTLTHGWVLGVDDPVQAHPLLNMLNVRYVLTTPGQPVPEGSDFRVTDQNDFLVLENPTAWPRAFFTDRIRTADSTEELTRQLLESKTPFVTLSKRDLEARSWLKPLRGTSRVIISAKNYRLLPNETAFTIHADSAGVVCLTESQAKDFTVTVNNAHKEILTLNRIFKGVYLERPGDYNLVFSYRPRYWHYSCIAFWAAVTAVSAITFLIALSTGAHRFVTGRTSLDVDL